MLVGFASMSAGSRHVERNASVRPYMAKILVFAPNIPRKHFDQRRRQRSAAIGQAAHIGARLVRPILFGQLHPQWRDGGERRYTMSGTGLDHIARRQIVQWHDTTARLPSREQLVLAIVETERQYRKRHIVCGQAQILRHADRAQCQVRMAEHHALWPPGGAAGVKDGGEDVGVGIGWQRGE